MYIHTFLISFLVNYVWGQVQEVPLVTTSQGVVSGMSSEDGSYYMYLGIPYGVVNPDNPFGPSSPHPAFEETFSATDDSAICPQREEFNNTLTGTLDCLHLSVFVPINTDNTSKAVLVWIFGGRFELGFYGRYLYGPKYLVRHDIILVTVNYRLGPYGFMCTDNAVVPGNQGLKDQLLALRWVKENIENFGGDPNRITIDGNSAGSMSSDLHIVSNHQPRLFNQVILQSGTSLSPSFPFPDKNAPITFAKHFGLETDDFIVALDFINKVDPLEIIEASNAIGFEFRPCIEGDFTFDGVESFLSHNWVANDTLPLVRDMNMMVGFNNDEGMGGFLAFNRSLENSVNESLASTFDIENEEFTGEAVARQFFIGDEDVTYVTNVLQGAVDIRSDVSFVYPTIREADRFLKNDASKVYMYKFTYSGGRNFVKHRINVTQGGAFHADEIGYLFDIEYMEEPTVEDQLVVDRMTEMWANFVKYGDPTPQQSNLLPVKWEPISPTDYNYIEIGADLTAGTRPFNERMAFWDLYFEQYGHLQRFLLDDRRNLDKWLLDEIIPY